MLRNHLRFRRERKLDELDFSTKTPVPIRGFTRGDSNGEDSSQWQMLSLLRYNGVVVHKWTRDGLPVVIFPVGNTDAKGTASSNTPEIVEASAICCAEFMLRVIMPELEQRIGRRPTAIAFIFDLKGLSLRQFYMPALSLFNKLMSTVHDHYPETLGVICLVNVPTIFQMFWSVVRPFIPQRTLQRIRFLGSDYQNDLLELIPPENLPVALGGLCTCRYDQGCIPYPMSEGYRNPDLDAEGYTVAVIKPNEQLNVPVAITRSEMQQKTLGSNERRAMTLSWAFKTDRFEVSFGVFFVLGFDANYRTHKDINTIKPVISYDSHQEEVKGTVVIQQPGTYVLRWVNTTTMRNTTVRYRVY